MDLVGKSRHLGCPNVCVQAGRRNEYVYDALGNRIEERRFVETDAETTIEYRYDERNRRIKRIDDHGGRQRWV